MVAPLRHLVLIAAVASAVVCADLAWRARAACAEGEKYLRWHADRGLQRAYWEGWLKVEEDRLKAEAAQGRITVPERRLRAELARAERDERVAESPLKYAVRWFETAAQFSPPPSPWSRRAADRLVEARALWERELQASGLDPSRFTYSREE